MSAQDDFNLIETLAHKLAEAILVKFPLVQTVTITVRKPSAPIKYAVDHVGVSVTRRRDG